MTSIGVIANSDKETIIEAISLLKQLPNFYIIFIKQSELKLYVVTDKAFALSGGG